MIIIKIINNILVSLADICSGRVFFALFKHVRCQVRTGSGQAGYFASRAGQTTVEYLLMLAVIVALALILFVRFHKQMLGGFFAIVGGILGAGTPK